MYPVSQNGDHKLSYRSSEVISFFSSLMSIGAEVQQYPAVEATLGDFFDGIRPVVAHWIEYMTSYTTRPQLSELQLNQRRESLDLHALIAQVSLAVVIVLFGTWTWTIYVAKRYLVREVESRPSSPQLKWRVVRRRNGWLQKISTTAAYVKWILGNEVSVQHVGQLGTLGQIIFGVLWLAWLLVLCYRKTAPGMLVYISAAVLRCQKELQY